LGLNFEPQEFLNGNPYLNLFQLKPLSKLMPIATFVNMLTVVIGSLLGLWLQQFFPPNIEAIIFQAIGLGVLVIGISMALKVPDGYFLIFIFSLIIGGILGELLSVQTAINHWGDTLRDSLSIGDERFTEGLVTAFILFCVGSITIVGAIEEGLYGKRELLLIKSTLDGFTSIAFASTYGIGVLFSIFPMLIVQGGLTVLASAGKRFFTETIIAQLSAVGGVLIVAVSINMLKLGTMNIENLLPAILVVVLLTWGYDRVKAYRKGIG
jgi:uncharacterized membrane protein YqgA involved in biofilm formation